MKSGQIIAQLCIVTLAVGAITLTLNAAPAEARLADLTHGIVVGGVTESSARFSLRLSGRDEVAVQISLDLGFSSPVQSSAESTSVDRNYVVVLDAGGLQPDTRYFYRAIVGGTPHGRVGSFMTFPTPGSQTVFTFGFGSCQQSGGFLPPTTEAGNVFRRVVISQPRFFLQLGDWGYPDTTEDLPFDSTFFAADFARVQEAYLTKFDPLYPMDSLRLIAPVDYVYDDHDYMNNNASALTSTFEVPYRPNQFGSDFVARDIANPPGARENSIRGYVEHMPTYPVPNESRGIYHKFTFANSEFFALDLRSQRNSNLEAFGKDPVTGRWAFMPPPNHSILGRDNAPGTGESQLTWLLDGLKNSSATWKFIMSSVPFNQGFTQAINLAVALQDFPINDPMFPPGASLIAAAFELCDKWAGFPADSDTLLNFIADNSIQNVMVLSGDSHTAAIDDGANAGLPEIMAGGLDISNSRIAKLLADFGLAIWNQGGQGLSTPDFNNAFGEVTVFGDDSVRLALVDEFGAEFASHTVVNALTSVGNRPGSGLPLAYSLDQNYPNPFNPSTVIRFSLPERAFARITVHNILGQEVARILEEERGPGRYSVTFQNPGLASGAYLYRLTASPRAGGSPFVQVRKLLILR